MMSHEGPWADRSEAALCLRQGRFDVAIHIYSRLAADGLAHADDWYNLGYALRMTRCFSGALEAYAHALSNGADNQSDIHINRAVILSEHLSDPETAKEELQEALRFDPGALGAWLNLGNLHEDEGDPAAAIDAYESALALAPVCGRALGRIAAIESWQGNAQSVLGRLQQAACRKDLPPNDAVEIAFALGNVFDALGRYDEAIESLEHANAAARELSALHYDRISHSRMIDAAVNLPWLDKGANAVDDADVPVFVCGMFRSGSTLLETILNRHPSIQAGGELEAIPFMAERLLAPHPAGAANADEATIGQLRAQYIQELRRVVPEGRAIDKRPDNFLHIGFIKRLFPTAKIIHTERNPLDTMISIYSLYFADRVSYGFDLDDIRHWQGEHDRLMEHWRRLYPGDILDISYEDLIVNPAKTIRSTFEFCGLSWDDRFLAEADDNGPIRTASAWQRRQPIHARSVGRWRNYRRHLARYLD